MYIVTDLVNQILTSEKAKELLDRVPPIYSDGYVALWLFQTMGTEMDLANEIAEGIEAQTNPLTATWSLGYWEESLGLKTNEALTNELRRSIISSAWVHGSMPPYRLKCILEDIAGVSVTITECKDSDGNDDPYTFTVTLGDSISESLLAEVRNKIDILKPSHLVCDIVTS